MKRRLSSVTIFTLVVFIPIFFAADMLYPVFMTNYLINKIQPENAVEMLSGLSYMYKSFPWAGYLGLIGALGSVAWVRRTAETVSGNLSRGSAPVEDSGK